MLRAIIATVLCLFLFGCFGGINRLNGRNINQNATFMLSNVPRGQCSGVILTPDGYILTASHCVFKRVRTVRLHARAGLGYTEAAVVAVDPQRDLALLKINGRVFSSSVRLHAGRELQNGDIIYTSGFPFGASRELPQLFGLGYIMNRNGVLSGSSRHFILASFETGRPGASGSGVYDAETGGLIGILYAVRTMNAQDFDGLSVVLVIPIQDINRFLRNNGLDIPSVND